MSRTRRWARRSASCNSFTAARQPRFEQLEDRTLLSTSGVPTQDLSASPISSVVLPDQGVAAPVVDVTSSGVQEVPKFNPNVRHEACGIPTLQQSNAPNLLAGASFPVSFDLRTGGYVTSVKNQGGCGCCWAFATMGSLESSILKAGGSAQDFSENNLKDYHGFDLAPCAGGNTEMSQAYFSRVSGPVSESDDPYHDYDDRQIPAPQYPVQDYVRESLTFDTSSEIKNALMTYGALYTRMWWDGASYNSQNYTYYYSGTPLTQTQWHAVTIIGWDDNKVTAGGTGAWLIKNSWGSGWGNAGYFWLAYQDSQGGKVGMLFGNAVPASTFNKVYYYDTFGKVSDFNSPYAFNASTATNADNLSAVQFWTAADAANYDIRVYSTYSGGKLSGLLASTTGTETYGGAHTVDLPSPVHLTVGQKFYVYLGLTNGGDFPQAFDCAAANYDSNSTASSGQSYYSFNGTSWTDLTTFDSTANFCIKALTVGSSQPTVSISPTTLSHPEGNSPTTPTPFVFTVTLSAHPTSTVTVNVNTADGTATVADNDYTAVDNLPLTFTPTGSLTQNVTVNAKGDTKPEPDETFTISLSQPVGATLGTATATGTIQNDDSPPTLFISPPDVLQPEGNSDTTSFVFTVTLSAAPASDTSVVVNTADGSATADSDYTAISNQTLIFTPTGELSQQVPVYVNGDTNAEPDETFTISLSNPVGATLGTATATGTIQDDDSVTPTLSISPTKVSHPEGDSGTTPFVFNVTLSANPTSTVEVEVNTADGTATVADYDRFGNSVAVSGSTIVVGAPGGAKGAEWSGAAYVFDAASGNLRWTLNNPSPADYDQFGYSVAVSGNTIVVGDPGDNTDADNAGAAYVFDAASGNLRWTLNNPTPNGEDQFGYSMAVSGNTIVVGAPGDNTDADSAGAAYVFDAASGNLRWTLNNPAPNSEDQFGYSMAVSGNTIVVGTPGDNTDADSAGSAYVFDAASGNLLWTLNNPSPADGLWFGDSVAVSGSTIVVGAPLDSTDANYAGSAYVFAATSGKLLRTLNNPTQASGDYFGDSVAVSGSTIVVGAPFDSTGANYAGSAYVFAAASGKLLRTLNNPTPADYDRFGDSVAVSGSTIVVGVPWDNTGANHAGSAYVFAAASGKLLRTLNNPDPADYTAVSQTLTFSPDGSLTQTVTVNVIGDTKVESDETFTIGLSNPSGARIATGTATGTIQNDDSVSISPATLSRPEGNSRTTPFVFTVTLAAKPTCPVTFEVNTADGTATVADSDYFGDSVAVSGSTIVVGAMWDDTGATDTGSVYVFDAASGNLLRTLNNPTPADDDEFGSSVAISGSTIVVGAPGDGTGATPGRFGLRLRRRQRQTAANFEQPQPGRL